MADIPGIIEGASEGKGPGLRFLRHIERNAVLLFMVPADADDISAQYDILLNELSRFNPQLVDKPRVLAVSKSDMLDDELRTEIAKTLPEGVPSVFISAVTGQGITELKDMLWKAINDENNRIDTTEIIHRPSTATIACARKTNSYSRIRPTTATKKQKISAASLPMNGATTSIGTKPKSTMSIRRTATTMTMMTSTPFLYESVNDER